MEFNAVGSVVLIVDAEMDEVCKYGRYLLRADYKPSVVGSVTEAREYLRRHSVDAVVVYDTLPDAEALDFTREFGGDFRNAPIMKLCLDYSAEKEADALRAGCVHCLPMQRGFEVITAFLYAMIRLYRKRLWENGMGVKSE